MDTRRRLDETNLLLATCVTTHYSLLTTYYSLLTTYYSLLTTYYSLLTTHYLLLTTNYTLTGYQRGAADEASLTTYNLITTH